MPGKAACCPIPVKSWGEEGNIVKENYSFAADYVCTAYTYPLAKDADAFRQDYISRAQRSGFAAEETTVEDYAAIRLSLPDGAYALLLPDFDGSFDKGQILYTDGSFRVLNDL